MQIITIKLRILFLCSLIFAVAVVFTTGLRADNTHADKLEKIEALELLNQATQFFREANSESISQEEALTLYQKAALRYECLINEYGITNGKLYYNLGNIYFMMDDIGKAMVNYLRAEQYIHDDQNLKQNLRYARGKRLDRIEEKQPRKVLKPLFFWHYNFSVKTRVILFSFFFALVWVITAFRIFFKRPFLSWCMTVSVIISTLMAVSLIADEFALKKHGSGVVINCETTVRKRNSETYEPGYMGPLHAGTEFVLLEDRGSWYHIKLADSRTCWIYSRDTALIR